MQDAISQTLSENRPLNQPLIHILLNEVICIYQVKDIYLSTQRAQALWFIF